MLWASERVLNCIVAGAVPVSSARASGDASAAVKIDGVGGRVETIALRERSSKGRGARPIRTTAAAHANDTHRADLLPTSLLDSVEE